MPEKAIGHYITEDDVDNWRIEVSATAKFATDKVNKTDDKITVGIDIPTGSKIRFTSTGVLPGGLEEGVIYYAIKISITIIQVASSPVNAAAEPPDPIDITSQGTETHTIDVGEGETLADRQAVIDRVEARVERITKDYFYPKTFYDFLDGNGRDRLFLSIRQKILSINYLVISRVEVSTIDKTGTDITSSSLFVSDDKADNKAFTVGIGDWDALADGILSSEEGGETGKGGKYVVGAATSTNLLKLDGASGDVLTNLVPGSKYRITIYAKKGTNWTGGIVTIKCDGQSKELPELTTEFVLTVFDFTANETDATITIDCATLLTEDSNELWIDTLEFVQHTGVVGGYTVTLTISTTEDYYKNNYLGIKDTSERVNNLWGSRILGNTATDENGKSVFTLEQPLKMTLVTTPVAADVVSIITNWDYDDDCIYRSPLGITHEPGTLMEPSEFFLNGYFPKGQRNIEIKGTIGHYSCPQAIKNACIILARDENDPTLYEKYEFEKESMGRVYSYDRGGEEYLSGIIECDRYLKRYVNRRPILVA